jgi:hypothetical protein
MSGLDDILGGLTGGKGGSGGLDDMLGGLLGGRGGGGGGTMGALMPVLAGLLASGGSPRSWAASGPTASPLRRIRGPAKVQTSR